MIDNILLRHPLMLLSPGIFTNIHLCDLQGVNETSKLQFIVYCSIVGVIESSYCHSYILLLSAGISQELYTSFNHNYVILISINQHAGALIHDQRDTNEKYLILL